MSKSTQSYKEPTTEEIATFAYYIYESEGRPPGKDREHWLQAEAQLMADRKAEARKSTAKAAPKTNMPAVTKAPQIAATSQSQPVKATL